jgi:glyoxylase-like metal-dependent hydrolase (beta-lactamase superfamily II)
VHVKCCPAQGTVRHARRKIKENTVRRICEACGTQYPETDARERCLICEDIRQFVPPSGQTWTTLSGLTQNHANAWRALRDDLFEIRTEPTFGIGQRALLVRTNEGNVLWDCISLLDDATIAIIRALGGLKAIAISHPHYYSTMTEWARTLDCPVWVHEADRQWAVSISDAVQFWAGDTLSITPGITVLRLGGHFPGGSVLHCNTGAGTLLSGDILQVTADRAHVSFMYSYPNYMPLSAAKVRTIAARLEDFDYESIYGSFRHAEIESGGKAAVDASVKRYIELIEDRFDVR